MMSPVTVELRRARHAGWRALAATVLVMSGATAAHGWAGGHVPAWPGLLLLGGVVLGTSTLLLRGVTSPRLLLPAVLVAQAGLHTSFVSMSDHASHTVAAAPSPWSGRMLLAHTAVALLTLLVWRLCERAAVAIVSVLDRATPYVLGRVRRRAATLGHLSAATAAAVLLAAPRRGPPVVPRHA